MTKMVMGIDDEDDDNDNDGATTMTTTTMAIAQLATRYDDKFDDDGIGAMATARWRRQ